MPVPSLLVAVPAERRWCCEETKMTCSRASSNTPAVRDDTAVRLRNAVSTNEAVVGECSCWVSRIKFRASVFLPSDASAVNGVSCTVSCRRHSGGIRASSSRAVGNVSRRFWYFLRSEAPGFDVFHGVCVVPLVLAY